MMGLRKLHRILGLIAAPLLLLQAVGGVLLRLKVNSPFFFSAHTWLKYNPGHAPFRVGAMVVAVLLGSALAFQAVTGTVMYLSLRIQQAKRKAAQRKQAAKTTQTVNRTP